jgi:glycosyltransferase involved in cell wall biosynthesis
MKLKDNREELPLRKVTIINQDSGYLTIDMANAMAKEGLQLSLFAGRLVERNNTLDTTIKVSRIIRYVRSSKFSRLLTWGTAFLQILLIVKLRHRKDHLFIISNPPFTIFLPLLCRNRYSLMVFDIYPEAIVQSGFLSSDSFMVRSWRKANQKIFSRAINVFTLTDGMANTIRQYNRSNKINVIPVWSDNEFFKPLPKTSNPFVSKHKLQDKFVVLYSGNLGLTHNIGILPEIAAKIKSQDIVFLIIGDIKRGRLLSEKIDKLGLSNCIILPLQPPEMMPFSFASADVALVMLAPGSSKLSIPSKTYNYMSAGLPLLCISESDSDLRDLVEKYDNGRWFSPDNVNGISEFLTLLSSDKELQQHYRLKSREASLDYTPKNAEIIAGIMNHTV